MKKIAWQTKVILASLLLPLTFATVVVAGKTAKDTTGKVERAGKESTGGKSGKESTGGKSTGGQSKPNAGQDITDRMPRIENGQLRNRLPDRPTKREPSIIERSPVRPGMIGPEPRRPEDPKQVPGLILMY